MVYQLVWENLKHRPVRTLLSSLAIGLGVTMMLTLVGVGEGMLADQESRTRGVGADIIIRPAGSSAIGITPPSINERLVTWASEQKHVKLATGVAIQPIGGVSTVHGVDYQTLATMSGGFQYISGAPFREAQEAIIDEYYAKEKKLKVGSTIKILNKDWIVSGIFRGGKLTRMMLPIRVLQDMTANTGKVSVIYVKLDDSSHTQAVIDEFKKTLVDYPIYSMDELASQFSVNNVPELKAFIGVVVTLSVLFGFLVVFLAMYTAILERTREIGILKALGASPGYVLGILLRETLLLALLGSVAGILMSYGTKWLLATFIPASMTQSIVYSWWPIAAGVTMLGAVLGVLYPAMKAARQDALESLSYD
ncbi:MAG: FtsX-like permease family protein [Acidobacteria bacterium]|nr:FtsX-like permease family protein [Acidobacteriota bacterium]